MRLFLVDESGWGCEFYLVRADSAERASELARSYREDVAVDLADRPLEVSADGPEGVLWSHIYSPDSDRT